MIRKGKNGYLKIAVFRKCLFLPQCQNLQSLKLAFVPVTDPMIGNPKK